MQKFKFYILIITFLLSFTTISFSHDGATGIVKDRMEKLGFDPESTKRISGPIGLNIGASNPAEIAVSILAEIISKLRQHKE